ncbi:hypothetical protein LEMLEM_LOCUS13394 [Lemmus lemmus]
MCYPASLPHPHRWRRSHLHSSCFDPGGFPWLHELCLLGPGFQQC